MATELAPIECAGCGAPVPLAIAAAARCRHCGHMVPIPPAHAALASVLAQGEADLRTADAVWKTLPAPRAPSAGSWITALLVGTVLASTGLWVALGVPSGRPGFTLVLMVLAPSLAVMCVAIDWLAAGAPWARLESAWSATVDARFPEVVLCRLCGAPLSVHEHAILARCAYCRADNLVRRPKPAAYRYVRGVATAGKEQLSEAIGAARTIFEQRRILRPVTIGVSLTLLVLFAVVLRER